MHYGNGLFNSEVLRDLVSLSLLPSLIRSPAKNVFPILTLSHFVTVWLMTRDTVCLGECSVSTWKGCVFWCTWWTVLEESISSSWWMVVLSPTTPRLSFLFHSPIYYQGRSAEDFNHSSEFFYAVWSVFSTHILILYHGLINVSDYYTIWVSDPLLIGLYPFYLWHVFL